MTAFLLPNGKQYFPDINGKPLVAGTVSMFVPNTFTPKNTWSDPGQTSLNTNPIILDSRGQASIYGLGAYRQIVKDSLGNLIWDEELENIETGITASGGLLITGTVGPNSVGARTDAGIVIYAPSGHAFLQEVIQDPSEEATRSDFGFDSGGAPAQIYSEFSRFVGGVNTSGSWQGTNGNHMPNGGGNDIVPRIHWSNGATALGCGPTAALPWDTIPPNNWLNIRSGHDGMLVQGSTVCGTGHAFSTKAGYLLEVNGFAQVGDVDGSGVTDHAIQMGYSSGGGIAFVGGFRNSTSALIPLGIGGSQVLLTNGLINAANDAAAAAAGVPITGLYRNGSVVMIRVT